MFLPKEMLTKPVIKTLKNGKIFCTLSATVGTALVCSCKGSNSSTVYFVLASLKESLLETLLLLPLVVEF